MLSALPLHECADKAAADRRLQAMGALLVDGLWVCLQSMNDDDVVPLRFFHHRHPKAKGSVSIAHPPYNTTTRPTRADGPGHARLCADEPPGSARGGREVADQPRGHPVVRGFCVCALIWGCGVAGVVSLPRCVRWRS